MATDNSTLSTPGLGGLSGRALWSGLAIAGAAFFLLIGYELIRPVSSSLFIEAYTSKNLPLVMFLSPIGTFGMLYFYGWVLSLVGAKRALFMTSLLSGLAIALCYMAIVAGVKPATGLLYILRESYIVLLIEQYWSFINSTLRVDEARKMNGPICGIASVGAMCGGWLTANYSVLFGSANLLIIAALTLLPAGAMAALAYHLGGEPAPAEHEKDVRQTGHLALGLLKGQRGLTALLFIIIMTQVVSTVLDLRFSGLLELAMPDRDARTAYLGQFYVMLNVWAFGFQFVGSPLLMRFAPLRLVHFGIPVVHLISCVLLFINPTLGVCAAAYMQFKVLDYSLFRAAKETIYIPFSYNVRYRVKEFIDSFVYRASKGGTSLLVMGARAVVGVVPGNAFTMTAALAATAWLFLVSRLSIKHPSET